MIKFLIILICIFLALIVLVQNSKGGGLSSSFGGGNQIMGVKKTADVLEKTVFIFLMRYKEILMKKMNNPIFQNCNSCLVLINSTCAAEHILELHTNSMLTCLCYASKKLPL